MKFRYQLDFLSFNLNTVGVGKCHISMIKYVNGKVLYAQND